jgi:hypothetical protein
MIISFRKLKCDEHTVYIFDKGYNDYKAFAHFTDKNTGFVTRIRQCKVWSNSNKSHSRHIHSSVLSDEIIEVEITNGTVKTKLKLKIKYYDREHKRSLNFLVICLTSDPTQ